MTVRHKPKGVDDFIKSGGDDPQAAKKGGAIKNITLRIPREMAHRIDEMIESRGNKMSRHAWILEAIAEKIAK